MNRTQTRGLADLDPSCRGFVLAICLDDEDLAAEGLLRVQRQPGLFSPGVWARALLGEEEVDAHLLRRLDSRLDLRFVEAVWFVREQTPCELRQGLLGYLHRAEEHGLPGLLWALATDARPQVQHFAHVLGQETFLRKCRELGGSPR